ncbi:DUF488 domain-containing protein [Aquamicrobium segne]|uniref:DUF488 domain-containing protein n=1 Tax=Aquamicrobium segne TaxID=469547 RepID=A0ABW0GUV7_9HYPH
MTELVVKRIYEPVSDNDGQRVLVDRLWPRGMKKEKAHLDLWLKDVAPSDDLRHWFGHDPERWVEFQKRYRAELDDRQEALAELRALMGKGKVTLLYSAHDEAHNNAVVLAAYLRET